VVEEDHEAVGVDFDAEDGRYGLAVESRGEIAQSDVDEVSGRRVGGYSGGKLDSGLLAGGAGDAATSTATSLLDFGQLGQECH
jgi:hypothetical protein